MMNTQIKHVSRFNTTHFLLVLALLFGNSFTNIVVAQSVSNSMEKTIKDIQWQSEEQVRSALGEPKSIRGPVGTHAIYTLWEYPDFTVAFANQKAFHLFRKDSLKTWSLNKNRR